MKTFEIEKTFPINVHLLFEILLEDASYEKAYHESKNDKDVDISDWMTMSPSQKRRFCFFTMVENEGKSEFESTRCMETQTCHLKFNETNESIIEDVLFESNIVPENPLGSALFKIESKWKISNIASRISDQEECKLKANISVECTKKIWGVTGMVESLLEKQARNSFNLWTSLATQQIQSHLLDISTSSSSHFGAHNVHIETGKIQQDQSEDNFVRLRLSTLKRVVKGTEKLAQLLNSMPLNSDSSFGTNGTYHHPASHDDSLDIDDDYDFMNKANSRCDSSIVTRIPCSPLREIVVSKDGHDDADLLPSVAYQRRRQRWKFMLPKAIVIFVIVSLLCWYLFSQNNVVVED